VSLTRDQAVDEILTVVQAAWTTVGGQDSSRLKYENVGTKSLPPTGQSAWARVVLRHTESRQATLSGAQGSRTFRRNGVLTVQVFSPTGRGIIGTSDLDTIIRDAYEGTTTSGGVEFRNVTINEVGQDGDFFQVNVVARFEYDTIR